MLAAMFGLVMLYIASSGITLALTLAASTPASMNFARSAGLPAASPLTDAGRPIRSAACIISRMRDQNTNLSRSRSNARSVHLFG